MVFYSYEKSEENRGILMNQHQGQDTVTLLLKMERKRLVIAKKVHRSDLLVFHAENPQNVENDLLRA